MAETETVPARPESYQLISAPGTAGLVPHILLQMSGAPYVLTMLDLRAGDQKKADYLKLNPNGRVPTLILPDKTPIFEAAAITMVLARRFPRLEMQPEQETQRALYDQWLVFLTNSLQADLLISGHPERLVPDNEAAQKVVADGANRRCGEYLKIIAAHLDSQGPYLLGDKICAADLYLAMVCRWARRLPIPPRSYPALVQLLDRVNNLPAVQAVITEEGIDGPFA